MTQMARLAWRTMFVVGLAVFVSGCGESTQSINGKITFDGEPLPTGEIIFHQTVGDGKSVVSEIENGSYTADLTAGEKRVEIIAYRIEGKDEYGGDKKVAYIPKKYNEQSTLSVDVQSLAGKSIDFELLSK